jgi:hypothetical protein
VKPKSATPDAGIPPLVSASGAARSQRSPLQGLIPIEGAARAAVKAGVHTDPSAFWMSYYKTHHNESPGELHETVRLLGANRRMHEVQAALCGYLWNCPEKEAWMYRALAMAMKVNNGSPTDISTSLNYAADLAQHSHNPNDLVSVADTMLIMGQLDRVGALLDEAIAKIPHRNEPLKMSVNLAQRTKDPARMGEAIEKLLSLGWFGEDDYIRSESGRQADLLAKTLREDGRTQEAAGLMDRLKESQARDVYIHLSWDGYADFDLAIDEPLGVTAGYELPRTVFGGSMIKFGQGAYPDEIYVCPRGFDGDYKVHIRTIFVDEKKPVVQLKLETIVHEGTPQEHKEVHRLRPDQLGQTFVVHLSGGRRKTVLPYNDVMAGRIQFQSVIRPAPKNAKKPAAAKPGKPASPNPKAPAAPKGDARPRS